MIGAVRYRGRVVQTGYEIGTGSIATGVRPVASISSDHNAERAIHRWAQRQAWRQLLPAVYQFQIVLNGKDNLGTSPGLSTHAALLPHEVFASLYSQSPALFEYLMSGGSNNVIDWWRNAQLCDSAWCSSHPGVANQPDPAKRIPLGIHGDDAGMAGLESVLAITWGSVSGAQVSTLDTRIAFTMVKTREVIDVVTMDEIYGVLVWSFEALTSGRFPSADHTGKLFSMTHHPDRYAKRGDFLAAGIVGCWSEMRGDWKFLKEAYRLKEHYNNHMHICHLCGVVKDTLNMGMIYTNFKQDALHRRTLVTSAEFKALYMGRAFASLLLLPGFCIWRVYFDYMHTHDLGITQLVVPSVMKELSAPSSTAFNGDGRQAKLDDAYRKYKRWASNNMVKSVVGRKFTVRIWCKGKYPHVTQNAAKAAAIRSMLYWLDIVCSRHTTTAHDATRASMVKSFVNADRTCRRAGRFLTPAQHSTLCTHIETALVNYNALASESLNEGSYLYKCIPKMHAATHVYDVRTNPRRTHCYADEDMVGKLKKIYNACHGASAPMRALQRYCILVGMRWWIALHEIRGLPYC